jgi:uncharacterized protein YhdP
MRKVLKLLGFITFTVLLLVVVAGLAFYHLIRVGEFRRFLIRELEQKTELKVQLGEADFEFGRMLGIGFNHVALSEPGAARPALTAERVTARVALAPLLERKLIFYEVRLHRPRAQLVRDRHGHIAVLDKLLSIPFLKHQDIQFNLDLRSIKIIDADVTLLDQGLPKHPTPIRLHDADIDVQRLRGQGLREFVARLTRLRQAVPQGPALEFRFASVVEKNGKQMTVQSRGKLAFPEEDLELDKAWWDADVQLINVPAAMVPELIRTRVPVNSLTGHFVQRLHMEGNPAQRLHVKGDVQFKQLIVDAPDFFSAPLPVGDGRADYEMNWTPHGLLINRLDYRAQQMKFLLKGDIRFQGTNPRFQVQLSALAAPLAVLRKYLPLKAIGSAQLENLAATFEEGEIQLKKAGVDATLSQLRAMGQTGIAQFVWFDAELRNARARLGLKGALPLQGVQGDVGLEKGTVAFKNVQANYGESRFFAVDGTYRLAGPDVGALDVQGQGELDLAELRNQLELGVFPADFSKASASVEEIGGKSRINFTLRRSATESLQFAAKGVLENVRLRVDDLDLSEISGNVSLSPKEINAENLKARLFGSPVQMHVTAQDYTTENGRFDLQMSSPGIKAGVITRLLLDSGSLQDPGVVRGSVHYRGLLGKKQGRKFTGQLDLANVRLLTQPLLEPIEDLNGRIRIDEQGIGFQHMQGVLVGFPVSFKGQWFYEQRPQLQYDLTAPNLDITQLLAHVDPDTTEIYGKLRAEGQVKLNRGRFESFEFRNLSSAVDLDRRVWRLTNFSAEAAGGNVRGTATIADKPDTLEVSLVPKIQGVPVRSFLGWFDIETSEMTGKVNLTGNLETSGKDRAEREKNLNGGFNLRVENGTLHRLRILVQILNLLDLSRWFTFQLPDLEKQGVRFRAITGDFQIKNGVYSTENLFVDSDDLRMTGAGKIDVPKNNIDFVVAVRPFAGIDTVINYIPLIGRSIAAIKNSFMVASFNIKGSIDDPTITPAPLSTLSEVLLSVLGIPKNILGFGGEENKGKPAKDLPTEPTINKAPEPAP